MHRHVARTISLRKREVAFLVVVAMLLVVGLSLSSERFPRSSAETRFVEHSASGLQIVPASCPSSPHEGGSCSGNGACNIRFSPDPVALGQGSTVFWSAPGGNDPYTLSYPGGSNQVSNVGSGSVGGESTKTYTLSYHERTDSGVGGALVSCSAVLTVCPAGYTVQNGQCVPPPNSCPAGQHGTPPSCICDNTNQPPVNGQCQTNSQCPVPVFLSPFTGTVRANGTDYVFTYISNYNSFAVSGQPSGVGMYESNGTVRFSANPGTQTGTHTIHMSASNSCGTATHDFALTVNALQQCLNTRFCIGNDVWQGDPQAQQCPRTHIEYCPNRGEGWTCSDGSCVPPPSPTANITATPSLIHEGDTSTIAWTSTNTSSCTVSENNPDVHDEWTGRTGSRTSSALTQQTKYTLTCIGLDGSTLAKSVIVNIIPRWRER